MTKIRLTPLSLSWRIRVNSISTSGIEAGGGLVEDQHLGRQVDGPTDSDDLLHRHRKAVQRLAHVEEKP